MRCRKQKKNKKFSASTNLEDKLKLTQKEQMKSDENYSLKDSESAV